MKTGELRYKPYGETRYSYGSTPTTFKFTGQREQVEIGLYFYQARWFDSALGRFISADSIIPQPGSPLSWDRYLYTRGNPLKYTDPSGHDVGCAGQDAGNCRGYNQYLHSRRADYKLKITLSIKADVRTIALLDSSDREYSSVEPQPFSGVAAIPGGLSVLNENLQPYANAKIYQAAEPDTFIDLHMDVYENDFTLLFALNVIDVKNTSQNSLIMRWMTIDDKDLPLDFWIGKVINSGDFESFLVGQSFSLFKPADSSNVNVYAQTLRQDDPIGGVRIPSVNIALDFPEYLMKVSGSIFDCEVWK